MRYRTLSPSGDYIFGGSLSNFYINSPDAVAQAVMTRLSLWLGEWFLDISDGTDWGNSVLGKYTGGTRDMVLRQRILDTPGVISIEGYNSSVNAQTRKFAVALRLNTVYGQTSLFTYMMPASEPYTPTPVQPQSS